MQIVEVGVQVKIKRSDGRVHAAVISAYNSEMQSVNVEWSEHGETKGKEIDLLTILTLNPQFDGGKRAATTTAPARASGGSLRLDSSSAPQAAIPTRKPTVRASSSKSLVAPSNYSSPSDPLTKLKQAPRTVSPRLPATLPETAQRRSSYTGSTPGSQSGSRDIGKKHRAVIEVERIQEDREERRQKQEHLRQVMIDHTDLSNPNWEFLQMIQAWQLTQQIERIQYTDVVEAHRICVAVRKRPLNRKEEASKQVDVLTPVSRDTIVVHEPKLKVDLTKYLENHSFRFDYAFDEKAENETVYKFTAKPLVETIFHQGMATCFAYGQTGSGKTYTMGGNVGEMTSDYQQGIYGFAAKDVFRLAHKPEHKEKELSINVSFFEIYAGKVFDLLNGSKKLRVLEDGKGQVNVVGLREETVSNVEDVFKFIQNGSSLRTSGQTSANDESSRSHAVFQIILRKAKTRKLWGKFSLIDLAGNERGSDTRESDRKTRMEGAEINKSLLALKECIRALGKNKNHTPFRASTLTQVLRDSFIDENARTCMIATMAPGSASCEHTLNTLRYADRVKELQSTPKTNRSPTRQLEACENDYGDDNTNDSLADLHRSLVDHSSCAENGDESVKFHEAVAKLADIEEAIVEEHRHILARKRDMLILEEQLILQADDPSADFEQYVEKLDEILSANQQETETLRSRLAQYKATIQTEV